MTTLTRVAGRFDALFAEVAKFGVVGALAFVVDFGIFNMLLAHGIGALTANATSVTVAALFSYGANRWWTYRDRETSDSQASSLAVFILLNAVGLAILHVCLVAATFAGFTTPLALNIARVVGTGLGTIFRFFTYRKFVFLESGTPAAVAVEAGPALPQVTPAPAAE